MKRYFLMILVAFCATFSAKSINYDDARREAWFLTDKMAYELNLTPEQCDRAYEINLEYLLGVHSSRDCFGPYWRYRNMDLRYVLFSWQYNLFTTLDYFYRPVRWVRSVWYYPVVNYYRPGYYYFDRPTIYVTYRGGRWKRRSVRDVSPYRHVHYRQGVGLRDRYHSDRNSRPTYRPEYGRPSRENDRLNRNDRDNHYRNPGNSHVRPDRNERPSRDFNNSGITNSRPNRGERPSRENLHNAGLNTDKNVSRRPSREFGHNDRNVSKRESRSHNDHPSRQSRERGTRDFGR